MGEPEVLASAAVAGEREGGRSFAAVGLSEGIALRPQNGEGRRRQGEADTDAPVGAERRSGARGRQNIEPGVGFRGGAEVDLAHVLALRLQAAGTVGGRDE